jgi:hypothetical protein
MMETKRFSLVKPTTTTPFHVDFEWWKQHDNNWKVYLHGCLCKEHQELFKDIDNSALIDIIDPSSAEIHQVDAIQQVLISHCARQPEFITEHTTLVDTVFRVFMANGNTAMSPTDLGLQTHRPPETILKTLAGPVVYKGIRPCHIC